MWFIGVEVEQETSAPPPKKKSWIRPCLPATGKCDWNPSTCTHIHDACPPDWERCPQYDIECPLATNHCCCRKIKQKLKSVPQLPLLRPMKKDGNTLLSFS